MNNMHVKKGDSIIVIAGADKGKTGTITSVNITAGTVLVDGLNLATHFVKPRSAQEKGGIIKKSAPITVSNVQLFCPACAKGVRAGHQFVTDGDKTKKIRVCKKCGGSLEVVKAAKKAAKKVTAAKKAATKKAKKAE